MSLKIPHILNDKIILQICLPTPSFKCDRQKKLPVDEIRKNTKSMANAQVRNFMLTNNIVLHAPLNMRIQRFLSRFIPSRINLKNYVEEAFHRFWLH